MDLRGRCERASASVPGPSATQAGKASRSSKGLRPTLLRRSLRTDSQRMCIFPYVGGDAFNVPKRMGVDPEARRRCAFLGSTQRAGGAALAGREPVDGRALAGTAAGPPDPVEALAGAALPPGAAVAPPGGSGGSMFTYTGTVSFR
jgi:hypothetical protein